LFLQGEMTSIQNQTTDEKLRSAILSRFAADDRTACANLRVGVLNGIVHLAGVVNSVETRILAAELAEEVPGVRGVVNRIEAPGAPSPARTVNLNLQNDKGNIDE
jgi:osmotically-inducible protein OsmY